jgi:hypothetical protein
MRLLRLVGSDENGTSLILETLEDENGDRFTVPIDDALRAAISSRPVQTTETPAEGATVPTPREIQVRVRAGETAQAIADEAGIPLERVMRFAYPVLQERIRVTDEARRARARRGGDGLLVPFGELLDGRLARHGVDPASVRWDAYRREDGGWTVNAEFSAHEREVRAKFSFALLNRTISALDDIAADLLSDRPVQALLAPPPPVVEPVSEPSSDPADTDWPSEWQGGAPPRLAAVPNPSRTERSRPQEATPAVRPPSRRQKAHTRPVPVSDDDELFDQNAFDQQPWHEPPLPFEAATATGRSAGKPSATPASSGQEQAQPAGDAVAADEAALGEDSQTPAVEVLDLEVLEITVLELDESDPAERQASILESIFDSANREPELPVAEKHSGTEAAAVAEEPAGSVDSPRSEPVRPAAVAGAEAAKAAAGSNDAQLKRGRRTGEKPRMPSWDDILLGVRHKSD